MAASTAPTRTRSSDGSEVHVVTENLSAPEARSGQPVEAVVVVAVVAAGSCSRRLGRGEELLLPPAAADAADAVSRLAAPGLARDARGAPRLGSRAVAVLDPDAEGCAAVVAVVKCACGRCQGKLSSAAVVVGSLLFSL